MHLLVLAGSYKSKYIIVIICYNEHWVGIIQFYKIANLPTQKEMSLNTQQTKVSKYPTYPQKKLMSQNTQFTHRKKANYRAEIFLCKQ